ncbi:MAG: ATP-binding protein, partial [Bacteroidota bacterium]
TKDELKRELQRKDEELAEFNERHNNCKNNLANSMLREQLLQKIIDQNPLSIQIFDKDGITKKVNQAHFDLFQATPPDTFCLFTDPQFAKQGLDKEFEKLKKGESINIGYSYYNPKEFDPKFKDELLHIRTIGFPILDDNGAPESYVLMQRDISKEKEDEIKMNELNNHLQELTEFLQDVREDERNNISLELHDELGQKLSAIKLGLGMLRSKTSNKILISEMDELIEMINESFDGVRKLTTRLQNNVVGDVGIIKALEGLICEFEKRNNLIVRKKIDTEINLDRNISLHFYRILQESLTNIMRHANADEVEIRLIRIDNSIEFSISDNGVGITDKDKNSIKSFGIVGMKKRSDSIGANFYINSTENVGTQIKIILPLPKIPQI